MNSSRGQIPRYRRWYRSGHSAVARSATRRGERGGARSFERGETSVGFRSGLARREFGAFRLSMDVSQGRFDEAPMIVNALKTGFIEGDGQFYKQSKTEIEPRHSTHSMIEYTRSRPARTQSFPLRNSVHTSLCSRTAPEKCARQSIEKGASCTANPRDRAAGPYADRIRDRRN